MSARDEARAAAEPPRPAPSDDGVDLARLRDNAPAIVTDIALGVLFFAVGKLADLRTAALVTAGAGLALVPLQWAINRFRWFGRDMNLLGGLAMFGIAMLLLSAAFSWWFDSEFAVQMKSTVLGLVGAACFGVDALAGGRWLGRRLSLYLAYDDIDIRRLAFAFAAVSGLLALANLAVALTLSKDGWLWYTLWGDFALAMLLGMGAVHWARRPRPRPATD